MHATSLRVSESYKGVEGVTLYEVLDQRGLEVPGPRLAIVSVIHGNEPVGLSVLERLAELAEDELRCGAVLTVRANPAAQAAGLRHTEAGTDLNRLWDPDTLAHIRTMPEEDRCYEQRRVLELAPLIVACDAVLDLHSTSRPAASFLLFRDDPRHAGIARTLGVRNLVTGLHENAILPGGLCSNAGLRAGEHSSRLGFTFEAGQHDAPGNGEAAWDVAQRLLAALRMWRTVPEPTSVETEVYEVVERFRQAPEGTKQFRFVGFDGGEPGGGRRGPPRLLHSFENIEADEVVLRRGRDVVVRAQAPYTMLMPAPDTAPGTDLYYTAQPRHGGLVSSRTLTDEQAREQAASIERMLDLLADDDLANGSTWASFDGRQLLDLCASVVGRVMRLPEGHPHRRITVVGRGDPGDSARERRAGQRYRQVMRQAMRCGIPVERIQLMRGAPLAWLDAITGAGMVRALEGRPGDPVTLRLSLRQPHTISMLVAGDIEAALASGNARGVRVALLVEAATAEPDAGRARIRIVRAGVLSGRPEVLRAASGMLASLRREHQHLVSAGPLAGVAEIQSLLGPDGAIEARPNPEDLAGLRRALYALQMRLWAETLNAEVSEPVRLRSEAAIGRWLAMTMASTGITDSNALRRMLVRPTASGKSWVADPTLLQPYLHSDESKVALAGEADPQRYHLPPQPLHADEVTANNLERWVGWKRFVRGVKVVPDTRGKQLDLAFESAGIWRRIGQWFQRARGLGFRRPGDVLVVVAGDGHTPEREQDGAALELLDAHRALLMDPNVHYLRIQHAQGTHLSWFKDFLQTLQQRPKGQSVALQWEGEHGAMVNIVMLATRSTDQSQVETRPWSLDGWEVEACAVVLADLEGRERRGYNLAMFTEASGVGLSQELVHFCRAHCAGLMKQQGWRVRDASGAPPPDELERGMVDQIARWIDRVRAWSSESETGLDPTEVSTRLGIVDGGLARALCDESVGERSTEEAAAALWANVQAWPGSTWTRSGDRL